MQCTFDKRDIDVSEEPLYQITWCHISGCSKVPANLVPNSNVSDSLESVLNLFKWSQLGAHYFLVYLFQLPYMFRATVCPSSGELTVPMRHWYFSPFMGGCLVCRLQSIFISTSLHDSLQLCAQSSEEHTVSMYLYGWLSGLLQQTRQPPIQSEKYQCRIDTVSSPDDGHKVARNM